MIPLAEIEAARERIAGAALRTPLVGLEVADAPAELYLKLENLQPIGSFKLRGAGNAMALASPDELERGVWTASAGNMAQGVAWWARRLGLHCTVVIPDTAPEAKIAAIRRLGAEIVKVSFDDWFEIFRTRTHEGLEGLFVHAFSDPAVMAGNGTIGLEILEDLPSANAVLVPFGGGGLSVGIASAVKVLSPDTGVHAVEPETGAPLRESFAAGEPRTVEYEPSFVDGSGSPALLPKMWELARGVLDGATAVSLDETAAAVRLLAERARVVAEGAGALALAAALAEKGGAGNVVCVVSGGNIDPSKLATILTGGTP
ncbi:MAG TPA: threonine/serine dehydratase [Gaiellaceae bacterium]|nr:threonine/serine dehydratase [Gaiellaceae bacterium]